MNNSVSREMVGKWLQAWSLSRRLPPPTEFKSGFKVEVGDEKQKTRYVFAELGDDFVELSKTIDEPWVYLKVCAAAGEVERVVSGKWTLQPQGYMMKCFHRMKVADAELPAGYRSEFENYDSTLVARIVSEKGEQAAIGRVVLVDDLAVYDRISTEREHRRKGLATFLMKELEKIAVSRGFFQNFLVATEEGKALYSSLGWEIYSPYTSVVITV